MGGRTLPRTTEPWTARWPQSVMASGASRAQEPSSGDERWPVSVLSAAKPYFSQSEIREEAYCEVGDTYVCQDSHVEPAKNLQKSLLVVFHLHLSLAKKKDTRQTNQFTKPPSPPLPVMANLPSHASGRNSPKLYEELADDRTLTLTAQSAGSPAA